MSLTSRVSVRRLLLLPLVLATTTLIGALAPASTAVAAVAPVAAAPVAAAPVAATSVPATSVADLQIIGTTTHVTVRHVYRAAQVRWINHVLDTDLVNLDGCQARRSSSRSDGVYTASIYALCVPGPAATETGISALERTHPWYHVSVDPVPLVGFALLADLPVGNGRAVPEAIAQLPTGPSVFYEGDDVSLTYAGPGVSQARFDAAVRAFAAALGLPVSRIKISSLTAS